jgi:uncharacterized protein with PQ loop repeat
MSYVGWIGGILLAICGLPQAIMSYQQGHSNGISIWFLLLWTLGEVFTLIYIFPKLDGPLLFNYISNLIFLLVIWKFKVYPNYDKHPDNRR